MKTTKKILWMALAMLMLSVGCTKKSSEKQMLSFKFETLDVEAIIDEETKTISATLPYYADIANLTPTIVFSENATVNPNSGVPMDFTNPVIYTVTAEDGSKAVYTVVVNYQSSSEKKILEFRFEEQGINADIDEEKKSISATMPYGTDISALIPTISISTKATISPASNEMMDFTNPVSYTITAEDGSQVVYIVMITVEEPEIPENPFLGVWGVERIEYYKIDFAGNPIASTMQTYMFDPEDIDDGIQLFYWEDNTGEKRDSSIDTIWIWNDETQAYDDFIVCPDTTIVNPFTYSYQENDAVLYMTMEYDSYNLMHTLNIVELAYGSFVYEYEYSQNYVEKAYMKRLPDMPMPVKSSVNQKIKQYRPKRQGSLLSGR